MDSCPYDYGPNRSEAQAMVFTGKEQIDMVRIIAVKGAMSLYLKTGMKPNSAYTPSRMRGFATHFTKKQYPRSRKGLQQAHDDLQAIYDAAVKPKE